MNKNMFSLLLISSCVLAAEHLQAADRDQVRISSDIRRSEMSDQNVRIEDEARDRASIQNRPQNERLPVRDSSRPASIVPQRMSNNQRQEVRPELRQRVDDRTRIDTCLPRERVKQSRVKWNKRGEIIRNKFADYRRRDHIFDDYFWRRFRYSHHHSLFDNRFSWSIQASWPSVLVWLPWKWDEPIYYYHGSNGVVYYSRSPEYTYLIPVETDPRFVSEAIRIASTPRLLNRDQSHWMPLGMFALSQDSDSSDMPREYISLAISKDGLISGAYFNVVDNETLEIQGAIDEKSQRVAWKFVGKDWPIMESGLFNLTKEESTVLIHFSPTLTESRLIIRLDQKL